ncbi:hypothetical protein MRB53_026491 [Persea americana]|uniref:Uncharacterized protein n=1 Tax=Persea americana TaxID=3435 RepID=A0ACC2LIS2_PERAE|nr:hypothetical protein MRB53_026491 [Persea americana]
MPAALGEYDAEERPGFGFFQQGSSRKKGNKQEVDERSRRWIPSASRTEGSKCIRADSILLMLLQGPMTELLQSSGEGFVEAVVIFNINNYDEDKKQWKKPTDVNRNVTKCPWSTCYMSFFNAKVHQIHRKVTKKIEDVVKDNGTRCCILWWSP